MSYTLDVNVPRKNDPILGKGSHEAINDVKKTDSVKNNWYTVSYTGYAEKKK